MTALSEAIQAVADGLIRYEKEIERLNAEIERLRAALNPFAEVARWAERNGHDLLTGWDMLLRAPNGGFAGHLQVQSLDFIEARRALEQSGEEVK